MLKSILKEFQVASEIVDLGSVQDEPTSLHEAFQNATKQCDMVITTGGVSMGEMDLVKPYIEKNGEVYFGRLNMKPGKPTTFGKMNGALMFALPGNPVSAFVTAHLFVVPAARILAGQTDCYGYQELPV
jgi:molybdenum cofactor synthesis domain-containing protein